MYQEYINFSYRFTCFSTVPQTHHQTKNISYRQILNISIISGLLSLKRILSKHFKISNYGVNVMKLIKNVTLCGDLNYIILYRYLVSEHMMTSIWLLSNEERINSSTIPEGKTLNRTSHNEHLIFLSHKINIAKRCACNILLKCLQSVVAQ